MKNYKCQIIDAKDLFELSCVDELIRDAFYNRKAISQEAYEMRKSEYLKKKKELEKERFEKWQSRL